MGRRLGDYPVPALSPYHPNIVVREQGVINHAPYDVNPNILIHQQGRHGGLPMETCPYVPLLLGFLDMVWP